MTNVFEPVTDGRALMHSMAKALGFEPETTTRIVLTLEDGSPPRVDISSTMTDEAGERVEDLIRTYAFWAVEMGLPH
jgi:hypothetical protein